MPAVGPRRPRALADGVVSADGCFEVTPAAADHRDFWEEAASVFAMPDGGDAPVGTRPFRPHGFAPDGSLALSCGALSARSIDRYPEEPPKTVYTDGKGCGDFPAGDAVRMAAEKIAGAFREN